MFAFILAVFSIKTYLWHQTDVVLEQLCCGHQQKSESIHRHEHQSLTEGGVSSQFSLKKTSFLTAGSAERFISRMTDNIVIKAAPAGGLWLNSRRIFTFAHT